MKKIEAIIKPFKLDDVHEALRDMDLLGLTISEVSGFWAHNGQAGWYRGVEYKIDFLPRLKLEVFVEDEQVQHVVDLIMKAARTGQAGDGKIFVLPLHQRVESVRVRTDDRGLGADVESGAALAV